MSEETTQSRKSLIGFALALILGAGLAVVLTQRSSLLEEGVEAPPFELTAIDGSERVSLAGLKGKVVLLDFWSTSCPPCIKEMRDLEIIHQRLAAQDVVVLGINTEGASPVLLRNFAKARGVSYKVLMDHGAVSDSYRVTSIPSLYLIDRDGKIRWSHVGYASHEVLEARLQEL